MAYGIIYGPSGLRRLPAARTKLPIDSIVAGIGIAAGVTPDTFVCQQLGRHLIDFDLNVSSPVNIVPCALELWNETLNMLVQRRDTYIPGQASPADMYFGFDWDNASITDEYAFYITPQLSTSYYDGFALLLQDLNFRAVVQQYGPTVQAIIAAASDETTPLTIGAAKVTFRVPFQFTLTGIRASVTVAPVGAAITVDVLQGGVSILSTPITIDAGTLTSVAAAVQPVIATPVLLDDAQMTVDVTQIGVAVAGAGLKVSLIGSKS